MSIMPVNQVPMGQIDAARAQTGNNGMPSSLPMNQTAMNRAPASAMTNAQSGFGNAMQNYGGGMQSRPPMPSQAYGGQMPSQAYGGQMPSQANRPGMPAQSQGGFTNGLPSQAAPQAQANYQQRIAALPPQAREQLRSNVMAQAQPLIQRAEQARSQMMSQNANPEAIAQVMQRFDMELRQLEQSAIERYLNIGGQS
jgi:hypothetical protein